MKQGKKRNSLNLNWDAEFTENVEEHNKIGDRLTNVPSSFSIAEGKHYSLLDIRVRHTITFWRHSYVY